MRYRNINRRSSNKRYFVALPIFFIAVILQTTFSKSVAIDGHAPNFLLCLVVVYSFIYQEYYGLIFGIIFGLWLDIITSPIIGVQTFTFIVAYALATFFRNHFDHERKIPQLVLIIFMTPFNIMFIYLVYHFVGYNINISIFLEAILYIIPYNFILTAILHSLFIRSVQKYRSDRNFTGGYFR